MSVSVVVVSWNAKNLLRMCLESICRGSSFAPSQVIVVDNCSTDGAPEMVAAEFPEVRLVRRGENGGYAIAVNEGIECCEGDYIAIVNSDIVVDRECLMRLQRFLEQNPKVGLVGPRLQKPDGTLDPTVRESPNLRNSLNSALGLNRLLPGSELFSGAIRSADEHERPCRAEVISGALWFVRAIAIREVGLLDEGYFMYAEDLDWCRRFRDTGWEVAFCPDARAFHHHGGSSSANPVRFHVQQYRAGVRYWRKFHSPWIALLARILYGIRQIRMLIQAMSSFVTRPHARRTTKPLIAACWYCCLWLAGLYRNDDDARVADPRSELGDCREKQRVPK